MPRSATYSTKRNGSCRRSWRPHEVEVLHEAVRSRHTLIDDRGAGIRAAKPLELDLEAERPGEADSAVQGRQAGQIDAALAQRREVPLAPASAMVLDVHVDKVGADLVRDGGQVRPRIAAGGGRASTRARRELRG